MEHNFKRGNRGAASLASVLIVSLVVFGGAFYYIVSQPVKAASLTSVKDTLSNSAPATASNHTIQFVLQTAVNESDTVVIEFDTLGTTDQFTINSLDYRDIDLLEGTSGNCDTPTNENIGPFDQGNTFSVTINSSTDSITFTATSTAGIHLATSSCVVIRIGTNAVFQASGTNQIVNPAKVAAAGTADIHDIAISFTGSAAADSGSALVAVIEGVTVSVTVDETLTFSIAGVTSGNCTQDGGASSTLETTATTVPFPSSSLSTNVFYKACQLLTVSTNASSGYAVTGQQNTSLRSSSGNTIDDTTCDDGACTEVVAASTISAWGSATNNGFGYTCAGTPCNSVFSSATEFGQFACTGTDAQCDPGTGSETAYAFASTSASVSNSTSTVVYKLSVSGTQPAGAYSNTITYIVTPTF